VTGVRRILGVTGTRAEFGLLVPVFRAIESRSELELLVAVCGAHLLPPARTRDEVAASFVIAAEVAMQREGESGRIADAHAFARGVHGFAQVIDALRPDAVLVLGDRIEAFAAASASAIAGVRVAHIHGGDRAEGVADESMRHATSKLSHLHLCASAGSAERLWRMGEDDSRIIVAGSPALDGLELMTPLDEARFDELGRPELVVLLHPTGRSDAEERRSATILLEAARTRGRVLCLDPNFDPGREGIVEAIRASGLPSVSHLARPDWIGLLRRIRALLGNSSAGLLEAAALRLWAVNIGPRQAGRERARNVIDVPIWNPDSVGAAIDTALAAPAPLAGHPFGEGQAGPRIAAALSSPGFARLTLTKRNSY
jgi:UDP-hydrolysing UDP-N-acetyl-D-glucosamine 2-epimerase